MVEEVPVPECDQTPHYEIKGIGDRRLDFTLAGPRRRHETDHCSEEDNEDSATAQISAQEGIKEY
jgi:hypothetical protein